jgi:hypothetical protein
MPLADHLKVASEPRGTRQTGSSGALRRELNGEHENKLKLNRETLRGLEVKNEGGRIKGEGDIESECTGDGACNQNSF